MSFGNLINGGNRKGGDMEDRFTRINGLNQLNDDNIDDKPQQKVSEVVKDVNEVVSETVAEEKEEVKKIVRLSMYQKRALDQALKKNKRQFKIQLLIEPGMSLDQINKSINEQMKQFEVQLYELKVDEETKKILS